MRVTTLSLLVLFVAVSACRSSLRTLVGNSDATAEAGIVDGGTGHETAPPGPEVAADSPVDQPGADRGVPDLRQGPETAPVVPDVAPDRDVDRPASDLSQASDLPPDSSSCVGAWVMPQDEQSCVKATCVPHCDPGPPPMTTVTSAPGSPLLTEVRVTSGSCVGGLCYPSAPSCSQISISGVSGLGMTIGATCDLVAVATDGRTQSFRITVVQSGPAFSQCCGYPLPPYSGQWVTFKPLGFDPSEVVVDFNRDGGVGDGGVGKIDGGNDTAPALQGIFVPTGSMTVARVFHTATLLGNGKVLIAGGLDASSNCLSSAELYDPATGTFKATGSMTAARQYHTATLLSNGKVLIAGGQSVQTNNNGLTSAELYDPAAGTFTATGSMIWDSQSDTATLLPSGEVLMAGGYDTISFDPSAHAELYDPAAGTFKNTGEMAVERTGAAATLLPSGRVLIAGGSATNPTSAELYDPATGLFTATGSMTGTAGDTAMLLGNGKVLIAGSGAPELYDPGSGTFTVTGSMSFPGQGRHTVTLLPSGEVLIAGGLDTSYDVWTAINTAELYDPSVGTFTATRSMTTERWGHTATLLPNGKVLITGGGFLAVHASAELYE